MKFAQVCRLSAAIATSLLAANAHAELNFNGFMSVAAGVTTDSDETLYGYDDSVSFMPDTLVGIQAMADLGQGLSATTQLIARGQDSYDVSAEWAYLSYQASPNFRINAGRQRMPLYIFSDYLDVGYAYHWVSPPGSFYNAPVSAFDGISLNYTTYLGNWETGLQVVAGSALEEDIGEDESTAFSVELEQYVGAVATIGYGPVTFRATYQQGHASMTEGNFGKLAGLSQAIAGVYPGLASKLDMEEMDMTFAGVGMNIDYADVLFVAEAREQDYKDNVIPNERAYYASLGYRIGDFMPYVTFERAESETDRDAYGKLALVRNRDGDQVGLEAVQSLNTLAEDARIYTVGLRYNLHPAATFKVEYTELDDLRDPEKLSGGAGGDVGLVRVAIDAVF